MPLPGLPCTFRTGDGTICGVPSVMSFPHPDTGKDQHRCDRHHPIKRPAIEYHPIDTEAEAREAQARTHPAPGKAAAPVKPVERKKKTP